MKTKEEAESFITDIRAVCRKHGFQLVVSDYDSLDLWALKDGDSEIHSCGIRLMADAGRTRVDIES